MQLIELAAALATLEWLVDEAAKGRGAGLRHRERRRATGEGRGGRRGSGDGEAAVGRARRPVRGSGCLDQMGRAGAENMVHGDD